MYIEILRNHMPNAPFTQGWHLRAILEPRLEKLPELGVTNPILSVPLFCQFCRMINTLVTSVRFKSDPFAAFTFRALRSERKSNKGVRFKCDYGYLYDITFIFDRCDHSWAVETPDKLYERDWKHLTAIYFCWIKISRNGDINERSCGNPHLRTLTCRPNPESAVSL